MLGSSIYSIACMTKKYTENDDPARLRHLVATYIEKNKKTQDALAKELGGRFTAALIYQHTHGNRPVSVTSAIRYSKFFNVPIDKIFPILGKTLHEAAPLLTYSKVETQRAFNSMDAPLDLISQKIHTIIQQISQEGKQRVLQTAEEQFILDHAGGRTIKKSG